MQSRLERFYEFLATPLIPRTRIVLALLAIPLALAFFFPLWRIEMSAPQYPQGLSMDIYAHTVTGGHGGLDIREINILNHYIGMKTIDRADLSDLDWIPFALGFLTLISLRCAAIGNVRSLLDLAVVTGYVLLFSMARFVYKLCGYGHHLNPDAPVKIAPFTPVIFGTKQIANFTTSSYPQMGTLLVSLFAFGLLALVVLHLWRGRARAVVADRALLLAHAAGVLGGSV
jgi:hypothetical protein